MAADIKVKEELPVEQKAGGLSFVDYVQIVAGAKELPEQEGDAAAMMAQIMGAESLSAGLGESQAQSLRARIGEEFALLDFKLNRSDDKFQGQGSPVYAVLEVVFAGTGERAVLTTGSTFVLAGLGLVLKLNQWGEHFTTKEVDVKAGKAIKLIYLPTVELENGEKF